MVIDQVFIIFLFIPIFFIIALIFNSLVKKKFCAVCISIFLSWILFLILNYLGYFQNKLILALLIGGTVSGIFNLLKERLNIFQLPFIMTLFYLGYLLFTFEINYYILSLILALWIIFILIYFTSYNKDFLKKLIECCKDW